MDQVIHDDVHAVLVEEKAGQSLVPLVLALDINHEVTPISHLTKRLILTFFGDDL
ncbi:hypothetical protein [Bacillus velezensis]|uniref:hypothetical protein n=1 Tax=Bacillus velezensis TaxID=492670 RepID=UPI0015CE36BA|nr:hypothetical protein [Bacillus velezensis]